MISTMTVLKRTPYQSLSAFVVLFFSLVLTGVLFTTVVLAQGFLSYIETRPQVTVYFQLKTPEGDIFKIRDSLVNSGKTLSVSYVSQAQAYEIYKRSVQSSKGSELLLEMVSADNLPASLEVNAKTPELLPELASFLQTQQGVDEVQVPQNILDKLLRFTMAVRIVATVAGVFLTGMTMLVLFTITHFKIALKKDEIELLYLLGATKSFIRKPFIAEARLFGLASSVLAFCVVGATLLIAQGAISAFFGSVNLTVLSLPVWPLNIIFFAILFTVLWIFGTIISVVSAFAATQKFINNF